MNTKLFKSVILSIAFLNCLASPAQAQTCQPVAPDLAAWWTADNNALEVRNRNNGTLESGVSYAAGKADQSFSFTGSRSFVVPDAPSLNPTTRFTFESWVYPTSDSGTGPGFQIIANKETSSTIQYEFGRRFSGGFCPSGNNSIPTGNFAMAIGGISGLPNHCGGWVNGGGNLPLNTWSHVAATYDGANLRAFVNGNLTAAYPATGMLTVSNGSFRLGGRIIVPEFWTGRIDEASLYPRPLSTAEIQSIYNADTAGKCKPTATIAPSGLVGFWAQDGNTNDVLGANNPSAVNAVKFEVGKVGQAIRMNAGGFIDIPHSASLAPANATLEAWVRPEGAGPNNDSTGNNIFTKNLNRTSGSQDSLSLKWRATDNRFLFFFGTVSNPGTSFSIASANQFAPNQYHHVAGTFDGTTFKLFVNGNLQGQQTLADPIEYHSDVPWVIGSAFSVFRGFGFPRTWNGIIDEVSLYNRALTDAEIRSIFDAGLAGKLKTNNTTGTTASAGDATITFPGVTTAGTTQQIPLAANLFPAVTMGAHTGLFYDIATSAVFTGNPTVCFNLPAFTPTEFSDLRVLHFTGGAWVAVTDLANSTHPTLCTNPVTSLSPFAIVDLTPLAADVSVSGRVTTADGRSIGKVRVSLTDMNGETRTAVTSAFGYYRFDEVPSGETYIISVSHKRYVFNPSSQVLNVADELSDINFTASE